MSIGRNVLAQAGGRKRPQGFWMRYIQVITLHKVFGQTLPVCLPRRFFGKPVHSVSNVVILYVWHQAIQTRGKRLGVAVQIDK